MRMKSALIVAGALLVLAGCAYSPTDASGNARGKGKLMKLNVPAAETFKTRSGRTGWKLKVPGGRPLATPAVANGVLFVGGGFGTHEFYALDTRMGKPRWTFKCGDDGPTAAVVDEGCVVYNTESCTIYIHDLETGEVLWHKWLGDPLMSQPAIGGGKVLMAYPGKGGHHLTAFELRTGKVVWDKKIAGEVISAPVVAGDFVVAATVDGTLYRFDLASGRLYWSKKCNVTSAPRVLGKQILISQRSEKKIEMEDDKGKKTTSTITVEGLNVASLDDGAIAHAKPLSPVKAAFLLPLRVQGLVLAGNAAVFSSGQNVYRADLGRANTVLENVKGGRAGRARGLATRTRKLRDTEVSRDTEAGRKDAEQALALAEELQKFASEAPANEAEKKDNRGLKEIAAKIQDTAGKTKEAALAAEQAETTIAATKKEVKQAKALDTSVGFANAPAAAKLQLASSNIGLANVKAVWAYQGSRPCLFEGLSIMVHGRKMRALSSKTGKVEWERTFDFKAEATRPVTPPALAGGRLYVGTVDGRIICLEAKRGKVIWQEQVGGRILFEPAVVEGCVYASTEDGVLICLNTGDKSADGWNMWGGSAKHNGAEK